MLTKGTRWRRINSYFKLLSQISLKSFLIHKKMKNWKFYDFFRNPKFSKFPKNRSIFCRLVLGHIACPISGLSTFLANIWPKNRIRWWHLFQTEFWSICIYRTVMKTTFLESWDQTGSEAHTSCSKITILKFDLLRPGIDLTLLYRLLFWVKIAK